MLAVEAISPHRITTDGEWAATYGSTCWRFRRCNLHRITIDGEWAATYVLTLPVLYAIRAWPLSPAAPVAWRQTDHTEATDVASWWKRLKAAPADDVEEAKELCTNKSLDAFITLLYTRWSYLPPPGDTAARLLGELCCCVETAYVNNTNLGKLRDGCHDLLNLILNLGHIGAFISTSRSSSELPKLPQGFASVMRRFNALVKKVIGYCRRYTFREMMVAAMILFLQYQHKEDYDELVRELHGLTARASLALDVDQSRLFGEVEDKLKAEEEARFVHLQARLGENMPFVIDKELEEYFARLKVKDYSFFILDPHLSALWRKFFMQEQEVTWGQWWTVFPGELTPDDTLNKEARQQLVDLLQDKESKDAFEMALTVVKSTSISIDILWRELSEGFLPSTVEALVRRGKARVRMDKGRTELAEAQTKASKEGEADQGQKLTPVKKECVLNPPQAQPEQGRQKVSPVQGGAQLFLSYRVSETGRKRHGGDRTVPQLKSALEAQGYSVFVGESDIEGGASWVQTIQVAITDCQVFIPVCSKTYGDTKWTLRELHAADKANKEILPLWHSGDYPPKPVSMYLDHVQRLPRGNQPLVRADFKSLVCDLVAAVKKAGCLPRNPPGPSNQALQGLALDQGRRRI